jgi:hypothetical protein
MLSVLA